MLRLKMKKSIKYFYNVAMPFSFYFKRNLIVVESFPHSFPYTNSLFFKPRAFQVLLLGNLRLFCFILVSIYKSLICCNATEKKINGASLESMLAILLHHAVKFNSQKIDHPKLRSKNEMKVY